MGWDGLAGLANVHTVLARKQTPRAENLATKRPSGGCKLGALLQRRDRSDKQNRFVVTKMNM